MVSRGAWRPRLEAALAEFVDSAPVAAGTGNVGWHKLSMLIALVVPRAHRAEAVRGVREAAIALVNAGRLLSPAQRKGITRLKGFLRSTVATPGGATPLTVATPARAAPRSIIVIASSGNTVIAPTPSGAGIVTVPVAVTLLRSWVAALDAAAPMLAGALAAARAGMIESLAQLSATTSVQRRLELDGLDADTGGKGGRPASLLPAPAVVALSPPVEDTVAPVSIAPVADAAGAAQTPAQVDFATPHPPTPPGSDALDDAVAGADHVGAAPATRLLVRFAPRRGRTGWRERNGRTMRRALRRRGHDGGVL